MRIMQARLPPQAVKSKSPFAPDRCEGAFAAICNKEFNKGEVVL